MPSKYINGRKMRLLEVGGKNWYYVCSNSQTLIYGPEGIDEHIPNRDILEYSPNIGATRVTPALIKDFIKANK